MGRKAVRPAKVFAATAAALLAMGASDGRGADARKGEAAFTRQCALCHTVAKHESNRFGPNLFGILNRRAGSVSGFKYSQAFQSTAQWEWNAETLKAWILGPAHMVPGTTMGVFQGVADRDSDDIIAYLASQK
ncbi:c-type cytochrome [Bradyrhizobium sp. ARR65]|uniref:c-type cytochrome n=1 Tax=Bradyrhizobium sp. ARR65 TaxID=1040989 RepID=UPI0004638F14|nr:c-type cytochrome [Bradyrhizobium sp. ARR65]